MCKLLLLEKLYNRNYRYTGTREEIERGAGWYDKFNHVIMLGTEMGSIPKHCYGIPET